MHIKSRGSQLSTSIYVIYPPIALFKLVPGYLGKLSLLRTSYSLDFGSCFSSNLTVGVACPVWLVLWPSAAVMLSFMPKKGREKRKTEKTAPQDDNSHLAELYVGFVKRNSQES